MRFKPAITDPFVSFVRFVVKGSLAPLRLSGRIPADWHAIKKKTFYRRDTEVAESENL